MKANAVLVESIPERSINVYWCNGYEFIDMFGERSGIIRKGGVLIERATGARYRSFCIDYIENN